MRRLDKVLPVLALGCGGAGFLVSSNALIVVAVVVAGVAVVRSVATLGGSNPWRSTRRRKYR